MDNPDLQLPDDAPEAVRYAAYATQRKQLRKKKEEPKPVAEFSKAEEVRPPEKAKAPEERSTPKKTTTPAKSKEPTPKKLIDRSSVPKARMSPHEVGTDLPRRLRKEIDHRLDSGTKVTMAQLVDELLHVGLESLERRRKKAEGAGESAA